MFDGIVRKLDLPSKMRMGVRLHERLADYAHPKRLPRSAKNKEATSRFVSLFLLAALLIPFFGFEFASTGYPEAAVVMALAGSLMLSSLWIYRASGSLAAARDVFLGSLFGFVMWEAFYFGSIYSPGSVWLVAMPVVSILLGSSRAGFVWLLIVVSAVFSAYFFIDRVGSQLYLISGEYHQLYTASVACVVAAVFLFVLIVDTGRARAYRSLEEANDAIRELADKDELTGLLNRRAFQKELTQRLELRSAREEVAVLIADLDGFKEINDTYGHHIGDKLIKIVTAGLRTLSDSRNALVARIGGDEFAILVQGNHARDAARSLAADALEFVREPFEIEGRSAAVGISVGIAAAQARAEATELLRRADVAMYEAKKRGKNQLCFHVASLDAKRAKRADLAAELAVAIDAGDIRVLYQPIMDARTRNMTGVEALARWTLPDGRTVAADDFIPVAEESGLINRLGMQILRKACDAASRWDGIRLSVNLSPVQFRSPTLVQDILTVLEETGFPAQRLELEVTEGYLIEHKERAKPLIETLHAAGIQIALDDFGTGYSSIGYLRQYAFDRLKIDKSLVRGLATDTAAQCIVQAIAILAQSLSLKVTAEGVESEDEANLLRIAGCCSLQGYHFGRPQAAESITASLTQWDPAIAHRGAADVFGGRADDKQIARPMDEFNIPRSG